MQPPAGGGMIGGYSQNGPLDTPTLGGILGGGGPRRGWEILGFNRYRYSQRQARREGDQAEGRGRHAEWSEIDLDAAL